MAKRNRGSNRPGQRHTTHSRHQPRPVNRPTTALTEAEEARAADLEEQIVARDRAVSNLSGARRDDASRARARSGTPLAIRAAEEYGYVSRDVKRILRVGGSMIAILAVFFVLVDVMHVIKVG